LAKKFAVFPQRKTDAIGPKAEVARRSRFGRDQGNSRHNSDITEVKRLTLKRHFAAGVRCNAARKSNEHALRATFPRDLLPGDGSCKTTMRHIVARVLTLALMLTF
jgi:hypothetical protein